MNPPAQGAAAAVAVAAAGMLLTRRRHIDRSTALLLAPSLLLLVAVIGVPLVSIALSSLQPNVLLNFAGPAFDNYRYLLSRGYYLDVLLRTFDEAALTTAFAVPLGYAAAMALREVGGRAGNLAALAVTFPILTGPLVVALGWLSLLPDGGPLFGPLIHAGLIAPPRLLGTQTAVLVSLVQFTLPFTMLTLYTAIRQIPPQLYEAAASLGAGTARTFLRVTLPLSLPGVLTAAILSFSLAASSYISPHYLGGAAQLTLTTLIAEFVLATYNSPLASASAIMLLILMLIVVAATTKLFARWIRP
jgi:ABC-type spermidine/putrescine transport system permease subunit I